MSLARNRKAYYDYEILDKFEAGLVLNGPEIKSIRNSKIKLNILAFPLVSHSLRVFDDIFPKLEFGRARL